MKKIKEEFNKREEQIDQGKLCWILFNFLIVLGFAFATVMLIINGFKLYGLFTLLFGGALVLCVHFIGLAVFAHFYNTMHIRNKLYEKELEEEKKDEYRPLP